MIYCYKSPPPSSLWNRAYEPRLKGYLPPLPIIFIKENSPPPLPKKRDRGCQNKGIRTKERKCSLTPPPHPIGMLIYTQPITSDIFNMKMKPLY